MQDGLVVLRVVWCPGQSDVDVQAGQGVLEAVWQGCGNQAERGVVVSAVVRKCRSTAETTWISSTASSRVYPA